MRLSLEILQMLNNASSHRASVWRAAEPTDFDAAADDDSRRRVVVDQVASLTDQVAIAWHGRLVGEVDAASLGVWAPRYSEPRPSGAPRPRGEVGV